MTEQTVFCQTHCVKTWVVNCVRYSLRAASYSSSQSPLPFCTWSKSHFMWLITINWKCSATKMFQIVTLQLCGVLTVQFGCRSCCWPTALSLWTALLCLLCRVDTFMFITQTLDFQPVSYTCKLLIIIPYLYFRISKFSHSLAHFCLFVCFVSLST